MVKFTVTGELRERQKHEQLVLRARNLPVARYGPRNTCYGQVGRNGARNGARNSPVQSTPRVDSESCVL